MRKFVDLMPGTTGNELADFVGGAVEKTTGFVVKRGLSMTETATLLILQRSARTRQLRQVAHRVAPPASQLITTARKVSPAIPMLAGLVARKAFRFGFCVGIEALKLAGRAIMKVSGK